MAFAWHACSVSKKEELCRHAQCVSQADLIWAATHLRVTHGSVLALSDLRPVWWPQIRLGGAKGVVSLNPRLRGRQLVLRPSMVKFDAPHHRELEVCSVARRVPCYLCRCGGGRGGAAAGGGANLCGGASQPPSSEQVNCFVDRLTCTTCTEPATAWFRDGNYIWDCSCCNNRS
jgi:hypothetical protein